MEVRIRMEILSYVLMLFGILLNVFGLIIWKKQKITLIHGYNNRNVKKEEIKEYTASMGKAYVIMGISMLLLVITGITHNDEYEFIGSIVWIVGFIISLVIIIKTQMKYKTGIFN